MSPVSLLSNCLRKAEPKVQAQVLPFQPASLPGKQEGKEGSRARLLCFYNGGCPARECRPLSKLGGEEVAPPHPRSLPSEHSPADLRTGAR